MRGDPVLTVWAVKMARKRSKEAILAGLRAKAAKKVQEYDPAFVEMILEAAKAPSTNYTLEEYMKLLEERRKGPSE